MSDVASPPGVPAPNMLTLDGSNIGVILQDFNVPPGVFYQVVWVPPFFVSASGNPASLYARSLRVQMDWHPGAGQPAQRVYLGFRYDGDPTPAFQHVYVSWDGVEPLAMAEIFGPMGATSPGIAWTGGWIELMHGAAGTVEVDLERIDVL